MGKTLLLASAGGHIDELVRLHPRLGVDMGDALWMTSETAQTRSLLEGRDVVWVPHIAPRAAWRALLTIGPAVRELGARQISHLVTTGAALALPYVLAARMRGIRVTYIESATRLRRPSLTGRIVSRIPGVERRCQSPHPIGSGWLPFGSVFDDFEPSTVTSAPVRRVVVSLGGEKFSFRRAAERMREILPSDVDVLWQTGTTPVDGLGIDAEAWIEQRRLAQAMRDADAVVIHAGVGSALAALDAGRAPVLLVRRVQHREHVDDHQGEIAAELASRGLATAHEADEITWADIERAAHRSTRRVEVTQRVTDTTDGGLRKNPLTPELRP